MCICVLFHIIIIVNILVRISVEFIVLGKMSYMHLHQYHLPASCIPKWYFWAGGPTISVWALLAVLFSILGSGNARLFYFLQIWWNKAVLSYVFFITIEIQDLNTFFHTTPFSLNYLIISFFPHFYIDTFSFLNNSQGLLGIVRVALLIRNYRELLIYGFFFKLSVLMKL